MTPRLNPLTLLAAASLVLTGCESVPQTPTPAPVAAKPKPAVAETEKEYTNISVSEAKGVSSPFKSEKGTIFPENKMGYKLVLSGGVSMPNLLATNSSDTEIVVQMRIYNRADYEQTLDIVCAVGEDRDSYQAKGVKFPANRARDIRFKMTQQAAQSLTLIVSRNR